MQYVIRKKGVIELGNNSCAFCHTRVMPDGSTLKGAQGNLPIQRAVAFRWRAAAAAASDKNQYTVQTRTFLKRLHAAPYLNPDPQDQIDSMSIEEISALFDSYPAGVSLRQRGNSFLPIQVPDLIGVKDRRYLDRTGLEIQKSIGDMMRYAALNQGADSLASYAGFIPIDAPKYQERPGPEQFTRYSDDQLYALARYIYSLEPPANPNAFDGRAARGKQVFEDEGCATCHRPPLYTNNRLTPAVGFTVPDDHREKFDVMSRSVGTDPELALRTRRGTGYYKVPSLKGVWYRSMFGHSGWAATLEDWFDPRRLRDDYVPTGWKPFRARTYPVKGHQFGLDLSDADRGALIAFLKTL
jgi:mono/diheme cytochrome c family protein